MSVRAMDVRETFLAWMDQFENDHYEFDVYGEKVTVDLARDTVEKVVDIALLLCDHVAAAQDELTSADYEEMEENVRKQNPDDSAWLFHVVMKAVLDEKLFRRYRDIEPMVAALNPRDYPSGSAAYLLTVKPKILELIYAVIRQVDTIEENYISLAYTFFIGVLTKGWGVGFGWSKTENGGWQWKNSSCDSDEKKFTKES